VNIDKNKIILLNLVSLFCFSSFGYNQESARNKGRMEQLISAISTEHFPNDENIQVDPQYYGGKCGLGIMFQVQNHWNDFNDLKKKEITTLLASPILQADTVIGRFRIFFDTTGTNTPALLDINSNRIEGTWRQYVDSVGKYFNYSWNYFIDTLGYEAPPNQVGNNYYNIYIEELYSPFNPLYGETVFQESDLFGSYNPPRYTSYIRIDNDFKDLRSEGIAGLSVTCAHELHHAFQLGSYGYRNNDVYLYEITSTWMEDVIFPNVNDYFQYIRTLTNNPKGQFLYPQVSFTSSWWGVSYSRGIWGKYVEKKFSRNIMKNTWNYFRQEPAINAIDNALLDVGSSFRNAFLEWTIWNNNTGPDCDTALYYDDGKYFPRIKTLPSTEYISESRSFGDTVETLASVYKPVCLLNSVLDNCNSSPQMMVIISNLNVNSPSGTKFTFDYQLSPNSFSGSRKLSNGIYIGLDVNDPANWYSQESVPTIVPDIQIYPNPYKPEKSKPLVFRLPQASNETAILSIFTSSMDKVIENNLEVMSPTFEPYITWDGHNEKGIIVSTGIYLYVISIDKKEYVGKFAVIKD
jgi:hypothetical protein